jgi:dihydrofolate reductase
MRKIIYSMMVSLDGFIEDSNGEIGWVLVDEELHRDANEQEAAMDLDLYGRRLYEVMRYWETADTNPDSAPVEVEFARIWQRVPKMVFSTTLEQVGDYATLVREVDPTEIQRLKEQPGQSMSVGGADLAATFTRLGLIDEYWLYVHPVILGGGKPYFGPLDSRLNLRLIETRTFGSGVVLLRYQRVAEEGQHGA